MFNYLINNSFIMIILLKKLYYIIWNMITSPCINTKGDNKYFIKWY